MSRANNVEVNPFKAFTYFGQDFHREAFKKLKYTGDITISQTEHDRYVKFDKYKINGEECGNLNSGQARALIYLLHNLGRDVTVERLYDVAGHNGATRFVLERIILDVNSNSKKFRICEGPDYYRMERIGKNSPREKVDKSETEIKIIVGDIFEDIGFYYFGGNKKNDSRIMKKSSLGNVLEYLFNNIGEDVNYTTLKSIIAKRQQFPTVGHTMRKLVSIVNENSKEFSLVQKFHNASSIYRFEEKGKESDELGVITEPKIIDGKSQVSDESVKDKSKFLVFVGDNHRLYTDGDTTILYGGREEKKYEMYDFIVRRDNTIEIQSSNSRSMDAVRKNSSRGKILKHLILNVNKPVTKDEMYDFADCKTASLYGVIHALEKKVQTQNFEFVELDDGRYVLREKNDGTSFKKVSIKTSNLEEFEYEVRKAMACVPTSDRAANFCESAFHEIRLNASKGNNDYGEYTQIFRDLSRVTAEIEEKKNKQPSIAAERLFNAGFVDEAFALLDEHEVESYFAGCFLVHEGHLQKALYFYDKIIKNPKILDKHRYKDSGMRQVGMDRVKSERKKLVASLEDKVNIVSFNEKVNSYAGWQGYPNKIDDPLDYLHSFMNMFEFAYTGSLLEKNSDVDDTVYSTRTMVYEIDKGSDKRKFSIKVMAIRKDPDLDKYLMDLNLSKIKLSDIIGWGNALSLEVEVKNGENIFNDYIDLNKKNGKWIVSTDSEPGFYMKTDNFDSNNVIEAINYAVGIFIEGKPTENKEKTKAIESAVDSTLSNLFTGDEYKELKDKIESAKLRVGSWRSVPKLNIGVIKLPTPGIKDINKDEAVVNGSELLIEYLSSLDIMPREEAESLVARKLERYFIHDSGFQLSRERASVIISSLESNKECGVAYG